ncbi:ectoine synthase [Pseudonocardia spinosispora]|uniref:ectoine synthase n=1 Tax=Pseudonocardia spinosispora TaxID=103441 RepID=UPI0004908A99|nr:ectoine synthase [Pseudonocardia spinosispora]
MIVRKLHDVIGTDHDVDNGKSTSRRLVVASDARGYTVTDTCVRAGTTSYMRYDRHLESCYCIEGSGQVHTDSGRWDIDAGTLYAPDRHEEHRLVTRTDMRLICVFSPALRGDENHSFDETAPSGY